ncbi:Alpha/Beta hydrolase protein, partial [Pyronema omphalodes]
IVAVHGLNGHAFDTWTAGDRMWLRDFLPHQLTRTRIMTYGYNSNVWDKLSTTTIPEFALALLSALVNKRGTKDRKRPIIFVCHSLGGIVVKLALNLARKDKHTACIAAAARGIVFLATPHRGSDTANNVVVGTLAKVLAVRQDLLIALRMDSRQLNEIDNEFRTNYENLDIATFYETKKTKLSRVVSSFDRVIVERSSATLQGKGPHFPIERDHRGICKFSSSHEDDYKAVYMQIARMVKKAKVTVAARVVLKGTFCGFRLQVCK